MSNDFYLYDLKVSDELTISFKLNDNLFEFKTSIVNKIKNDLILDVIKIEDKVLNLTKSDISINLIYERKERKPLIWNNCSLILVKDKENSYYRVRNSLTGKEINRRKDFRVPIGLPVEVSIGDSKRILKGNLKDLSSSGFAIIVDKRYEVSCDKEDLIKITFDDMGLNYHINLLGKVVRLDAQDVPNEKILYGCYFLKDYPNIGQYLSLKQRENLMRHSDSLDLRTKKSLENIKKIRKVIK